MKADARPLPKNKDELIALLKEQLEKLEDEITAMQTSLDEERQNRNKLTAELETKEAKIQELIEQESQTLTDKVNQGLYSTLEAANKLRAVADAEIRDLTDTNNNLNEKIIYKDNKLHEDKQTLVLNAKRLAALEEKKHQLTRKSDILHEKRDSLQKALESSKKEFERLEREQHELSQHLDSLKKTRLYLNKMFEHNVGPTNNLPNGKSKLPNGAKKDDDFWN